MQIRRNENLLFPNIKSNTVQNNKFLAMAKTRKEDTSATLTISKLGRARARKLEESSKKDEYMNNAEARINKILDTLREGGTLSKEEEELVNNELKIMSEQKYQDYRDLRLEPEDVLTELKENYLRRERLFFDMQEQLEGDSSNQLDDFDTVKIMTYMQEKENEEEIIEIIKEYAEEDEEKNLKENVENEKVMEKGTGDLEINIGDKPVEKTESEGDNLQKRAMKMIENIENQINDTAEAREKARKHENDFANGLEEDYKRIQQVLNNHEISVEDKVNAYDRFLREAEVNAKSREVQRIKKQFDAETIMMARIMFQGRNQIDNVIKGNVDRGQIGTEFLKSFLIPNL